MTPQKMLEHMQQDIIFVGYVPTRLNSKTCVMYPDLDVSFAVQNANGSPRKHSFLFSVKPDKNGTSSEKFTSYICNYADGKIKHVYLGSEADYCFTFTMNQCTFGIGQQTSAGVLVSHANARVGGAVASENRQAEMTREYQGNDVSLFGPSSYLKENDLAVKHLTTTMGLRMNGKWTFYAQSYWYNPQQKTVKFDRFQKIG